MKHHPFNDGLTLLGRLLLAALFLPSAVGKLGNFEMLTQGIAAKGLPLPAAVAGAVIALEVVASLALIAGWRVRWAALALAVFTLLAGLLFHSFWQATGAAVMAQHQAFFKNIGIVGGLLVLAAQGPGRFSLDARTDQPAAPPAQLHPSRV